MKDGLLYINDAPVQRERLSDFVGEDPCGSDATARVKRWKETLPNGVSYETLDCVDNGFYDNTNVYNVPPGHYFMMGDNRDNSTDSRVLSAVGYVPFENLIGRAQMIFFSIAEGEHAWMFWRWPVAVRWNRIFSLCAMNDDARDILTPSPPGEPSAQPDAGGNVPAVKKRRSKGSSKAVTAAIEARIGHKFADATLLATALTHVSALKPSRKRGDSYQRLEFLGDHVLGLVVSDMLYRAFPDADEGELSKRLADLVRKESCADVAKQLGLLDEIKLGSVGAGASARLRKSVLGDVCEAVIGAVYLDGGHARRSSIRRAQLDRADAQAAPAVCATPRRSCRSGRRAKVCRRRSIERSNAPARIMIRNSVSRWTCRAWSLPKVSAAASAPPKKSRLP